MHLAGWTRNGSSFSIESIIRSGIAGGEFNDPHPDFTARFIPSMVRSVMEEGSQDIDARTLTEHILRFVRAGLLNEHPQMRPGEAVGTLDSASGEKKIES